MVFQFETISVLDATISPLRHLLRSTFQHWGLQKVSLLCLVIGDNVYFMNFIENKGTQPMRPALPGKYPHWPGNKELVSLLWESSNTWFPDTDFLAWISRMTWMPRSLGVYYINEWKNTEHVAARSVVEAWCLYSRYLILEFPLCLSRLRIQHSVHEDVSRISPGFTQQVKDPIAKSCGISHRCSLDLALLWLWRRPQLQLQFNP